MAQRKYITELGINMHCVRLAIAQQHSLAEPKLREYFDEDHPCHIYAICRRPRISLRPEDVSLTSASLSGTLRTSVAGKAFEIPFTKPRGNETGE